MRPADKIQIEVLNRISNDLGLRFTTLVYRMYGKGYEWNEFWGFCDLTNVNKLDYDTAKSMIKHYSNRR